MDEHEGPALDDHQYTVAGLRSYEAVYGRDFVSPGGQRTTSEILETLDWVPDREVLDVGFGLGGAAFMMANRYQARVFGVDLSLNMAVEAHRRCTDYGLADRVDLVHGDILTHPFTHQFDLVHSREVFLHIHDKAKLFETLNRVLRPGGRLLFTDYCRGSTTPSDEFGHYMSEFGYDLRTVDEVGRLLVHAGFTEVSAVDQTEQFIEIHRNELAELATTQLGPEDQDELRAGWSAKIERARRGEQRWGWFRATR